MVAGVSGEQSGSGELYRLSLEQWEIMVRLTYGRQSISTSFMYLEPEDIHLLN